MQDRIDPGTAPGLRGRVRGTDGWAVPGAVLTVTDRSGAQAARAEADEDGAVRAGTLDPGVYTAIVTAPGYRPAAATAIVPGSGSADLGTLVVARLGGNELPSPGTWTLDPAHTSVGAIAQHLGLAGVRGRFTRFTGRVEIAPRVEDSTVHAEIESASIDTGNATRDEHLRSADFLDAAAHPLITYHGTGLTPAGPDRYTVHGRLTLNGVRRDVDLDLHHLGVGGDPWGGVRLACRATTELRRADFAMNYNQMVRAGIAAVGATLKIELDVQAVRGTEVPGA